MITRGTKEQWSRETAPLKMAMSRGMFQIIPASQNNTVTHKYHPTSEWISDTKLWTELHPRHFYLYCIPGRIPAICFCPIYHGLKKGMDTCVPSSSSSLLTNIPSHDSCAAGSVVLHVVTLISVGFILGGTCEAQSVLLPTWCVHSFAARYTWYGSQSTGASWALRKLTQWDVHMSQGIH